MKSEERRPGSLKWGLTLATLLCWILPIIIVTAVAAASLNYYYDRTIKQTADAGAENAMRQAELRLASAIEDSKAVSYEGIVRQAYRDYQHTHDRVGVYRTVTEYLSQKYSRNASFSVIYISFLDEGLDMHPYAAAQGSSKYNLLRNYTDNILPAARECIYMATSTPSALQSRAKGVFWRKLFCRSNYEQARARKHNCRSYLSC